MFGVLLVIAALWLASAGVSVRLADPAVLASPGLPNRGVSVDCGSIFSPAAHTTAWLTTDHGLVSPCHSAMIRRRVTSGGLLAAGLVAITWGGFLVLRDRRRTSEVAMDETESPSVPA